MTFMKAKILHNLPKSIKRDKVTKKIRNKHIKILSQKKMFYNYKVKIIK